MKKHRCLICNYIYDPEVGIPDDGISPHTDWDDVHDEWTCPLCSAGKDAFEEI